MKDKRTLDNDTFASNPGNVELNKWVWFRHNMTHVSLLSLSLFISILAALCVNIGFLLIVGIAIFINIFYWSRIKEHFLYGDSNGGIVVATHPTLIVVVSTNLTKGFGYFPVIKIIECPSLKSLSVGDRIPTVAVYTPSTDDSLSHWIDFDPIPLTYATNDSKAINKAMQSYSNEQWEKLESYLLAFKKPYKTGLYPITTEDSDWNQEASSDLNVLSRAEIEQGNDSKIYFERTTAVVILFIGILNLLAFLLNR